MCPTVTLPAICRALTEPRPLLLHGINGGPLHVRNKVRVPAHITIVTRLAFSYVEVIALPVETIGKLIVGAKMNPELWKMSITSGALVATGNAPAQRRMRYSGDAGVERRGEREPVFHSKKLA